MIVIGICLWLMQQNKYYLKGALFSSLLFSTDIALSKWNVIHQKKFIVYNIPHQQLSELISGNHGYFFVEKNKLESTSISITEKATHVFYEVTQPISLYSAQNDHQPIWQFYGKKMLCIDTNYEYQKNDTKIKIDFLIISKNTSLKMAELIQCIQPGLVIFDASNMLWKISKWKRECEALNLRCYSIPEQGAFVYNIK